VHFEVGDAERLPLADASVDVVVSECALCTFPDKLAAATEMARVVRRGGRIGITDVVLDPARLDPELADLAGWVACLADARPVEGYQAIFGSAGLETVSVERHDEALGDMIDMIDARITALAMARSAALADVDLASVRRRVAVARRAVADGVAGYALMVARRP
jgi:SAM-dependent methyltransferase